MILTENKYTNISGTFPDAIMIDASGAGLTDGSEFAALPLNDGWEAFSQAIMDYADGGTNVPTGSVGVPNGVRDAKGVSQIIQAIQLSMGGGPGTLAGWFGDSDPSVTGHRILLLQGQGILIANYPDLVSVVYVGDPNNATVAASGGKFYKSSDAGGATPNVAGPYLQLPEGRGYTLRGLDLAASVDPLGASRFLGDNQVDAAQGHFHGTTFAVTTTTPGGNQIFGGGGTLTGLITAAITDGANGTPRTSSETRMSNLSIKLGIVY